MKDFTTDKWKIPNNWNIATIGELTSDWRGGASLTPEDFTDEGFYLNWIAHPSLYKASHTQFGFIYHPLYLLFGGDIVLLRQANILITLALAWLLFFSFFRTQAGRNEPADSWHTLPCA